MQTMSRARAELLTAINASVSHIEQLERDAARARWRPDLECEVLLARMGAAALRRELTR